MRPTLHLRDERDHVLLTAIEATPGEIEIHTAVGGTNLTPGHVKELVNWLDSHASKNRQELDRLRAERTIVRAHVNALLDPLEDAWWLRAANAYNQLHRWAND